MKNILFLCTGNSCRSQMAEGICKNIYLNKFSCYSAGMEKHGLNKYAVKVLLEIGIDITTNVSKTLLDLEKIKFDYVFTVCSNADKNCPIFNQGIVIHKAFEDPPSLTRGISKEEDILQIYRKVRDEIFDFIKNIESYIS